MHSLLSLARYSCASLWSQSSFISLWEGREPVIFNESFAEESTLWLTLQQGVKWCRVVPFQAIHPGSDGEDELLTLLSKLCLAILPLSCPFACCTSIQTASGYHPMHLPQIYKAATAFIGMARVICSAWMGLTIIWHISAPLGSAVKSEGLSIPIALL